MTAGWESEHLGLLRATMTQCGQEHITAEHERVWCSRPHRHRGDHVSASPTGSAETGWLPVVYARWPADRCGRHPKATMPCRDCVATPNDLMRFYAQGGELFADCGPSAWSFDGYLRARGGDCG